MNKNTPENTMFLSESLTNRRRNTESRNKKLLLFLNSTK